MTSDRRRYLYDLVERAVATFLQGALGSLPVTLTVADVDNVQAIGLSALIGGLASLLSLLKSWAAKAVGEPNTAAFLPAEKDTPEPESDDAVGRHRRPLPGPH